MRVVWFRKSNSESWERGTLHGHGEVHQSDPCSCRQAVAVVADESGTYWPIAWSDVCFSETRPDLRPGRHVCGPMVSLQHSTDELRVIIDGEADLRLRAALNQSQKTELRLERECATACDGWDLIAILKEFDHLGQARLVLASMK